MKAIQVEHQPDQSRLTELGVYAWPIWEKAASEFPWHYDEKETAYILEGEVIVTADDGSESVEIKAGDLVIFAAGLSCRWQIKQDLRKHYQFG
ncbi:cupin domain-containing protein [Methylophaga sp.]|uniref:cupin domain-containing protein n=1 Tax=Methylophaga sp. TaxID=2024840 RepID=UPI001401855A|nr:cupin domain-containing protein [Methylophaga sp.]MTI63836.1 cupin domain-containing protein [Methylophaga sp.]